MNKTETEFVERLDALYLSLPTPVLENLRRALELDLEAAKQKQNMNAEAFCRGRLQAIARAIEARQR
jgi:hypothetical protein